MAGLLELSTYFTKSLQERCVLLALEIIEHLLFECSWTKLVWFASPLGLRQSIPTSSNLYKWLELLISSFPSKIQAL